MLTLAAWLHDLDPVALDLGPIAIRWYGLAYLAGFVIGAWLLRLLARRGRVRIRPESALDFILYVGVGVIVGGRLGYCLLYRPELFVDLDPSSFPWWGVLRINDGGMASHGGMIGLLVGAWLFARRQRVATLHLLDALALVGPPGLLLGRLANFVNGELLGRIAARAGEPAPWWSVKYPQELLERPGETSLTNEQLLELYRVTGSEPLDAFDVVAMRAISMVQAGNEEVQRAIAPMLNARHPSQLYQALVEGVILMGVLWWIWRKPRRDGVIVSWFLILYGIGRVVTEVWRLPDSHFATGRPMGLSRGQWYSIALALAGAALLWIVTRRKGAPRVEPADPGAGEAEPGDARGG